MREHVARVLLAFSIIRPGLALVRDFMVVGASARLAVQRGHQQRERRDACASHLSARHFSAISSAIRRPEPAVAPALFRDTRDTNHHHDHPVMLGDAVMDFGKYKGMTVADVRRLHPTYIAWARSRPCSRGDHFLHFLDICREMDEVESREDESARTSNSDRKRARVDDGEPRRLDFPDGACEQSGDPKEGLAESGASASTCDESCAPAPSDADKEESPEVVKETAAADAAPDSPKE